jgi:hypothetical protein
MPLPRPVLWDTILSQSHPVHTYYGVMVKISSSYKLGRGIDDRLFIEAGFLSVERWIYIWMAPPYNMVFIVGP